MLILLEALIPSTEIKFLSSPKWLTRIWRTRRQSTEYMCNIFFELLVILANIGAPNDLGRHELQKSIQLFRKLTWTTGMGGYERRCESRFDVRWKHSWAQYGSFLYSCYHPSRVFFLVEWWIQSFTGSLTPISCHGKSELGRHFHSRTVNVAKIYDDYTLPISWNLSGQFLWQFEDIQYFSLSIPFLPTPYRWSV